MTEITKQTYIKNKQLIALAAIFFLAPAIRPTITGNNIILSEDDNNFVESYIQLGRYILYILASSGIIRLLGEYVFTNRYIKNISQWIAGIIIMMIVFCIYAIFREKQIIIHKKISRENIQSLFKKS